MTEEHKHLFLSYCHENKAEVAKLRKDLIEAGEEVWWDQNIPLGRDLKDEIKKALKHSYAFLWCLSKESEARSKSGIYPEILDAIEIYREYKPGSTFIIPVRLSDCEIPSIKIDATRTVSELWCANLFPANTRAAELEKLKNAIRTPPHHPFAGSSVSTDVTPMSHEEASPQLSVTKPGFLRYFLDRYLPHLHNFLTDLGTLPKPPELDLLNGYLRELRAKMENDIKHKTYIPIAGKEVPSSALLGESSEDPFIKPIHQIIIREIIGQTRGGDSVSAQIAAVNRRSRLVRNIMKTLLKADDPLVLLGDPGTGKTMTLQQTAIALADSEIPRVFPIITLYVRLGKFHINGNVGPDDVLNYVKHSKFAATNLPRLRTNAKAKTSHIYGSVKVKLTPWLAKR